MTNTEFVEIRICEEDGEIKVLGTSAACVVAMALWRKHSKEDPNAKKLIVGMYTIAKEMQLRLVSAYHYHEGGRVIACRCFQGELDVIKSVYTDQELAEYYQKVREELGY